MEMKGVDAGRYAHLYARTLRFALSDHSVLFTNFIKCTQINYNHVNAIRNSYGAHVK